MATANCATTLRERRSHVFSNTNSKECAISGACVGVGNGRMTRNSLRVGLLVRLLRTLPMVPLAVVDAKDTPATLPNKRGAASKTNPRAFTCLMGQQKQRLIA